MIWTRTRLIARLMCWTIWKRSNTILALGKRFTGNIVVRAKHIHSNNFHSTSDGSIIFKEVISNDGLCSTLKNSDDIELIKILRNETHLHLPIETVTPLTVSTSQDIISGRREKSCLKRKSLSLRMTVEVEMAS